jgi:hypothetical protein
MTVFLTQTTEDCLGLIWGHDRRSSEVLADAFQRDSGHAA